MRRLGWALRATAILIVACVALVAGTALVAQLVPDVPFSSSSPEPQRDQLTAVSKTTTRLEHSEILALEWSSDEHWSTSAATTGIVTAVLAPSGDVVRCGELVVSIDGQPVVAWCGRSPLWRSVTAATPPASDTDDLRATLSALGYLATASPTRAEVRAALRAFQYERGMSVDGSVEPAETVWIGDVAQIAVDHVDLAVGDVVPERSPVLSRDAHLTDARLTDAEQLGAGSWEFQPVSDPGSRFQLMAGGAVSAADLAALEHSIRGLNTEQELPSEAPGIAESIAPIEAIVVPAGAIAFDPATSSRCVFSADGAPITAQLLRSAPENTLIHGDLRAGDFVWTIAPSDRCSS